MEHDPLCPEPECERSCVGLCDDASHYCQCEMIAKARADEREQAAQRVEALSSSPYKEKVQGLTHVTTAAAAARGEEP